LILSLVLTKDGLDLVSREPELMGNERRQDLFLVVLVGTHEAEKRQRGNGRVHLRPEVLDDESGLDHVLDFEI
jgi:hypothetical protein